MSAVYPEYQSIALHVCGVRNLQLDKFEPKPILKMCIGFGINPEMVPAIIEMLKERLPNALATIEKSEHAARGKYLSHQLETDDSVLVTTNDID
jgi:hypothetical protein